MSDDQRRRDEIRLAVLKHMYNETIDKLRDPEGTIFDAPNIAEDVPFSEQEITSALDYLEGRGLVRGSGPQFIGEQRFYRNYNILHSGIDEIERRERMEAEAANERKEKQRLAVLKHMYEVAVNQKGNPSGTLFNAQTIADAISLTPSDVDAALTHLSGDGLVTLEARPYDGLAPARISHQGTREVQKALSKPVHGTEHFTPQVIQNLSFYAPVGAVPTGPNATTHVTLNIGADLSSVLALIGQLRQQTDELPEDEQEEVRDTLDVLDAELKGEKDPKRIRTTLRGLASFGQGTVTFASKVATLVTQVKDLLPPTLT